MAYYAALNSLVQLFEEISHPGRYPYSLSYKQQIASLHEKWSHLQELLGDYYSSRLDKEAADALERRIRDAAYRAQDIIEYRVSHKIPPRYKGRTVRKLLQKLEEMKEEIDSIVKEAMMIKEGDADQEESLQVNSFVSADSTSGGASKVRAPSGENTMVRFDEQLVTAIKAQLCGESSKLEVISIVGMGGIGKTTLAEHIFDDRLIAYHFYCRAWVTISQNYHLRKVLLDIGKSIISEDLSGEEEGVLAERIYKSLKGSRYLIVMDDVWDTKVWDDIKRILPDDSIGSRVITTSRLSSVAGYVGRSEFIHPMQFLNQDQSWNLFSEKVLCPPELEDTGRMIANNCGGLPLAIVVVAGLISKVSKTRYAWEEIARNVSLAAAEKDEHVSKILSLSYDHLPHHLKPCFLYLGGFPEDYEIPISKLIKLWVAEGFIKPNESKSLERVAEEYLEDLVNRKLVLVTKKGPSGKFRRCCLHDLLRDLCSKRASEENFIYTLDHNDYIHPETAHSAHRRLYIHLNRDLSINQFTKYVPHVRSILVLVKFFGNLSLLIPGFKFLRVFDSLSMQIIPFPDEILEMIHLRYLALNTFSLNLKFLSLYKLQNLQTLILLQDFFVSIREFSLCGFWKMPHLRHVIVNTIRLSPIPYGERIIGEVPLLGKLQTLSRVKNFRFTRDAVEMIPSLKKLKVYNDDRYHGKWQEFRLNNLVLLSELEALHIKFDTDFSYPEPLPESFAFPQNLKKLTLGGCKLPWKDMRVVGLLPNLQVLKLRDDAFVGEEWEPIQEELFPRLKFLEMAGLDLKYWRAESTHFPMLEHLEIRDCYKLEAIPSEIGEIPTLELIEVYHSKSAADSAMKIQQEQQDLGNDALQVRIHDDEDWF